MRDRVALLVILKKILQLSWKDRCVKELDRVRQ